MANNGKKKTVYTKKIESILDKQGDQAAAAPFLNSKQVYKTFDTYDVLQKRRQEPDRIIIAQLKTLCEKLEDGERLVYKQLKITDASQIKTLQSKIDDWNQTNFHRLLDESTAFDLLKYSGNIIDDDDFLEKLSKWFNDTTATDSGYALIKNDITEPIVLDVASLLNEQSKSALRTGFGRGINTQINFTRSQKDGWKASINTEYGLKDSMKIKVNSLLDKLNNPDEKKFAEVKQSYKDSLMEYLLTVLGPNIGIQSSALEALRIEWNMYKNKYGFSFSLSTIKGWLGELYWNVTLKHLFGNSSSIMAVGKVLNTKGRQLSVDIIADALNVGFQVKNWTIADGKHRIDKEMQLGNFMKDRAECIYTTTGRILAQMFATLAYNQPNPAYANAEFDRYKAEYQKWRNSVENDLDNLTQHFYAFLNKIIGIDRSEIIPEEFYNKFSHNSFQSTFWLINDKIIPSSIIIRNMIAVLERQEDELIKFEVTHLSHSVLWRNVATSPQSVWPAAIDLDPIKLSNRWKIKFFTEFNLDALLERAANYSLKY